VVLLKSSIVLLASVLDFSALRNQFAKVCEY
jgi:hypothetical protein